MLLLLVLCFVPLAGCNHSRTTGSSDSNLVIEQYFYSGQDSSLKKLADRLETEGYQIHDYQSYDLDGKKEWSFYSSKTISTEEIDNEDRKCEKYAIEYHVRYDGHGFPLK